MAFLGGVCKTVVVGVCVGWGVEGTNAAVWMRHVDCPAVTITATVAWQVVFSCQTKHVVACVGWSVCQSKHVSPYLHRVCRPLLIVALVLHLSQGPEALSKVFF